MSNASELFSAFLRQSLFDQGMYGQLTEVFISSSRRGGQLLTIRDGAKKFSLFGDPHGYAGYTCSEKYINRIYRILCQHRENFVERHLQTYGGTSLAADGSFKVAKQIRLPGKGEDKQLCEQAYSVFNEFGQILKFSLTNSSHSDDRTELLEELKMRYELHGFSMPERIYLDNCCQEGGTWEKTFPSLRDGTTDLAGKGDSSNELFEVSGEQICVHTSRVSADIVLNDLLELAGGLHSYMGLPLPVGFDMEWAVGREGQGRGGIAVLQIAVPQLPELTCSFLKGQRRDTSNFSVEDLYNTTSAIVHIIHLARMEGAEAPRAGRKGRLPVTAQNFFHSDHLLFVGNNIVNDQTLLNQDYGSEETCLLLPRV